MLKSYLKQKSVEVMAGHFPVGENAFQRRNPNAISLPLTVTRERLEKRTCHLDITVFKTNTIFFFFFFEEKGKNFSQPSEQVREAQVSRSLVLKLELSPSPSPSWRLSWGMKPLNCWAWSSCFMRNGIRWQYWGKQFSLPFLSRSGYMSFRVTE